MSEPDSLLIAAKKVTEIIGKSWSDVIPYYSSLQESRGKYSSPWLPKSIGRHRWYAHPNYITRLLIALACADRGSEGHAAVDWVLDTTPDGREFSLSEMPAANVISPMENAFHRFLTNADAAKTLDHVEFQPDQGRVVFHFKEDFSVSFERVDKGRPAASGIVKRTVISGDIFLKIAEAVRWRFDSEPPFGPEQ